jgi:putative membrane protein
VTERRAFVLIGALSAVVLLAVGGLLLGGRPAGPGGRLDVSALPAVNAALNGLSALLLATGYALIRRRRVAAHRACMVAAFAVSTAFLVSYVVYHAQAGSVRFTGQGAVRAVYFVLLLTHIVLAAAIVPLALLTLYRAWSERFDRHRRIARWTLPIWLYVSVSGVLVYWMLYHLAPGR